MSTSFEQCSLYLHPEKHTTITTSFLISELKKFGLIAKSINDENFYIGENYLDYIAYMGCAPNIQFEASDDNENYCFIKIHHYDKKQLILSRAQARPPQCQKCRKSVINWEEIMTARTLLCENCNNTANLEDYNWRKLGGFAQLFIEITDIFPKEAIPQQLLLDKLSKISNTNWQYFYSCN